MPTSPSVQQADFDLAFVWRRTLFDESVILFYEIDCRGSKGLAHQLFKTRQAHDRMAGTGRRWCMRLQLSTDPIGSLILAVTPAFLGSGQSFGVHMPACAKTNLCLPSWKRRRPTGQLSQWRDQNSVSDHGVSFFQAHTKRQVRHYPARMLRFHAHQAPVHVLPNSSL